MSESDRSPDARSREFDQEIVELIPALRAFARTFYRDRNEADDLVQETLAKAIAKVHQFAPGTKLKSWLFTIMRNSFYTRIKLAKREAPGAAECVSEQSAVDPLQEWSIRGREVAAAVERLPVAQREVMMLIAVGGVSYEEAAKICGCAMGTIKSRLSRARINLSIELGESSVAATLERDDSHPADSLKVGYHPPSGPP